MEQRGSQTEMPRAALPRDPARSENIIWGVALALAALFALGQGIAVLAAAPAAIAFHREAGQTPWFVGAADSLGLLGLVTMLVLIDTAVLALFAWLGRRYWIGFIFLPPLLYLGVGSVILWLLLSGAMSWVIGQV